MDGVPAKPIQAVRHAIASTVVLTLLVVISLAWNINNIYEQTIRLSTIEAEANWKKDQAFRRWATRHGGVYVTPDERTPRNRYLAHLPNRDLKTSDGNDLTLMNPAYMMRQMTGEFEEMYGVKGKITGQVLLNPINRPDPWELSALKAFDRGVAKVVHETQIDGQPYLRLMRPMVMEEGCLQCHGHLGFKVGDIRGGVSVSIPLVPYFAAAESSRQGMFLSHGGVWFTGLFVVGFTFRRRRVHEQAENHAQAALRQAHDSLEHQVADRTKELTQSEANLRTAQTISHLGSWQWMISTGEQDWNDEQYEIFGIDRRMKTATYQDFEDAIYPDDKSFVLAAIEEAFTGSPFDMEFRIVWPNGEVRFIHAQGVVTHDAEGKPISMLGTALDNTEGKRAEQRIRETAEQLESMFGTMAEGVFSINAERTIESVNPMTEKMFGYSKNELIGMNVRILMADTDRQKHDSYVSSYLEAGEKNLVGSSREVLGRHKDGTLFPIKLSVREFASLGEKKFIGTLHDLTAQKAAEQDLIAARHEAEASNRAKSTFLASASHDVRQPLQALGMFLAVLDSKLSKHPARDDETIKMLIDRMGDSVLVLGSLFDSLLDISKLEAQTLEPQVSEFDLGSLMSRLSGQFEVQANSKGLRFSTEFADMRVRCDETLLSQILCNFLSNAIRYTETGEITFRAEQHGNHATLQVRDEGAGIPTDKIDVIFDDFYQVGNEQRDRTKGMGLGLAIAKRTADLLGLQIKVESEEGNGSTFSISVPLVESACEERPPGDQEDPSFELQQTRSRTVLAIDDDKLVLESLKLCLEGRGYKTLVAPSFDEALELLEGEDFHPDIIISDLRLSTEFDGVQVIAALRDRIGDEIPGFILTGDTSPARLRYVEDAGLTVFHKPVEIEDLVATLEKAFE